MVTAITSSTAKSTILQKPIFPRDPSCKFFGGSLNNLCVQQRPKNKHKDGLGLVVASSSNPNATTSGSDSGRFYFNFTGFPFPLGPFLNRRTIRTEVSFISTLKDFIIINLSMITFITFLGVFV